MELLLHPWEDWPELYRNTDKTEVTEIVIIDSQMNYRGKLDTYKENPFPAIAPSFRDIIKENHWTVLNFLRLSCLESGDFRGYARLSRTGLLPCHVCLRHRRNMVPILLWMDLCDWHLDFLYLPFSPPYWPHLLQREVLPRRRLEGWAAQSKSSRIRRKSETPALR